MPWLYIHPVPTSRGLFLLTAAPGLCLSGTENTGSTRRHHANPHTASAVQRAGDLPSNSTSLSVHWGCVCHLLAHSASAHRREVWFLRNVVFGLQQRLDLLLCTLERPRPTTRGVTHPHGDENGKAVQSSDAANVFSQEPAPEGQSEM